MILLKRIQTPPIALKLIGTQCKLSLSQNTCALNTDTTGDLTIAYNVFTHSPPEATKQNVNISVKWKTVPRSPDPLEKPFEFAIARRNQVVVDRSQSLACQTRRCFSRRQMVLPQPYSVNPSWVTVATLRCAQSKERTLSSTLAAEIVTQLPRTASSSSGPHVRSYGNATQTCRENLATS